MATLTVRVDDDVRQALMDRAEMQGESLSDLIRRLLLEAVVPVREEPARPGEVAPETLSPVERRTLSLLHRILGRVLPADEVRTGVGDGQDGALEDQLNLAHVLEEGFAGHYAEEFAALDEELSSVECSRVMDILDMFSLIDVSLARLDGPMDVDADEFAEDRLRFRGFDHNKPLERKMSSYVRHLILVEGRWEELQDAIRTGGNSHMPMLDTYVRMLGEHRRIVAARPRSLGRDSWLLTRADLEAIARAGIHPTNR